QGRRRRDPRTGIAQRLSSVGAGRSQPGRRVAQAARPVCQYPPGAKPRRLSTALRIAGRPRHRAREHRGLLRRPLHVPRLRRVHAHGGPGALRAQGHARGLDADRGDGFRARRAPPQEGDGGAQSQRAAGVGRTFSRIRARGGAPFSRRGERIIDAMAALLVRAAIAFDVIVTTNMFGDILSDLAAEISGSLGLAASLNAGEAHALAQAQHGSAPDIAGEDRANPASLIGSAAMLLNWLGERRSDERFARAAATIEDALDRAIASPQWRTRDLGGAVGTEAVGTRVAALVAGGAGGRAVGAGG